MLAMLRGLIFFAAAGILLICGPAAMAANQPFYKGKRITFIGNYPPGGSNSIEGRIFIEHLSKHLAGHPTIVFRDMAGAGGLVATNYLGEVSKPDGLTAGFFTWDSVAQLLDDPGLRVRYDQFAFIAAAAPVTVAYVRKDVKPGINKPADFLKAHDFKFGGLRATGEYDLKARLSLDLLLGPDKYKVVTGFKGFPPIYTAIHQNEIQFHMVTIPGYRGTVVPTMVKPGLVIPVYHYGIPDGHGGTHRSDDVPNIPTWLELYKMKFGKMPSGIKWETLNLLNTLDSKIFRVVLMPPGTTKAAVDAMREGFSGVVKDPEFIADYRKVTKGNPHTVVGEEGAKLIGLLKTVPPEVKTFLKSYAKAGSR